MLGLGLACVANAEVIAGYDFGTPSSGTLGPTIVAAGASANQIDGVGGANDFVLQQTIGDNTGYAASGVLFGSTEAGNFSGTANDCNEASLAGAITGSDYVTFTVTADAAGTLTVTNLSVAAAIAGNKSAEKFNILAQVNGGTTWDAANALTIDQTITASQGLNDWDDYSLDLSGDSAFQNIDSVEFRIYMWGGWGSTSSSRTDFDQIVVEGTIPEPATLGLFAALGTVIVFIRRQMAM